MPFEIGILAALAALIFWGFGDFLIQRSARKFGDWETLFVICIIGTIILSPFIYNDIHLITGHELSFLVLTIASITMLVAALLDFEALKKGKIVIIEPILTFELPITAVLAFTLIGESLGLTEILLVSVIIAGLMMISLRSHHFSKKVWVERGAFLALTSAVFMGTSSFLIGFASRITDPLLTNWFLNLFLAIVCLSYIIFDKRTKKLVHDFKFNTKILLAVGTIDSLAWVSFAIAASLIPIAIAVAVSESYIALAALLGILINKEVLLMHQKAGLVISLLGAITLSAILC